MKTKFLLLFMSFVINTSLLLAQTMGGGDGSQANPYKISNTADWTAFRTAVSGSSTTNWPYCELANDIDMSTLTNNNLIIGQGTYPFRGVFDGKGHKISNLKIGTSATPLSSNSAGLFAGINGATIKNLEISVAFYAGITTNPGYTSAGGLVAIADLASTIQDCKITGIIYMTNSGAATKANGLRVGGIVGMISSASAVVTIINCVTDLDVRVISTTTTAASYYGTTTCGGILGDNANGSIIYIMNCNVNGSVYALSNYSAPLVGGIMGQRGSGSSTVCQVYNCLAENTVEGYNNSTTSTLGCYAGGIAGNLAQNSGAMQVKNCIALNPSVKSFTGSATIPTVNRISTKSQYSVFDANYAKNDMPVIAYTGSSDGTVATGTPVTITINNIATDANGANLGADPADEANSKLNAYVNSNPIFNSISLTSWNAVNPGIPTAVIATAGNAQVSIAFTAPVYNGGSAIIDFTVTSSPGGFTQTGASSPLVISGLVNGTAYTFTVKARNSVGNSAASSASSLVSPSASAYIITVSSLPTNIADLTLTPVSDISISNGGLLTVNAPTSVNSITIAPGAKLTLTSGNTFTVNNGITLQSDATGTATFVDENTSSPQSISAIVQQYLPQGRNWYISSPVRGGDASSLTASGTASSVSWYDEPNSTWINNYTGSLIPGKGYVAVSNTGIGTNNIEFSGILNTGNVNVTLTRQGSTNAGYNLVANPYPSFLNPMDAINANSNLVPTIWFRTQSAGLTPTYYFETVNTTSGIGTNNAGTGKVTGYIPPMQAFWLRTNVDAQTLTFNNAMRYHANPTVGETTVATTAMKTKNQINQQLLRLQVSNGTNNDEAVIYFNPNASNGYDVYDSPKRSNANSAIPEIYTIAGTEQLVINGLKNIIQNQELLLGFTPGIINNFSIKATEISNFDTDTHIILKDNQTNTDQDLTDGTAYVFSSDAVSTVSRFTIIFRTSSITTALNSTIDNSNQIFVFKNANNQITVNIPTEISGKASVSVYNAVGQNLENGLLTNIVNVLNKPCSLGVYLVNVTADGKTTTRKVVIN